MLGLQVLILFASQMPAQVPLKVLILQGDGAMNDIRTRIGRSPVVEVRDEQDRPQAGAIVNFSLPSTGAGGSFIDGGSTFQTKTD
jgi:hypothetical protein